MSEKIGKLGIVLQWLGIPTTCMVITYGLIFTSKTDLGLAAWLFHASVVGHIVVIIGNVAVAISKKD